MKKNLVIAIAVIAIIAIVLGFFLIPRPSPISVVGELNGSPVLGLESAPVEIVEYGDFQCPYCGRFYLQTFPKIDEKYIKTGKVKLVYKDFPLKFHQNAQKAAEAGKCAFEQGKFWEFQDRLFRNQNALGVDSLKRYASDLGMDAVSFNQCLDSGRMASLVNKDYQEGVSKGVEGTPAFFVNGDSITGAQPFEAFEKVIESKLSK